jgi:hypothetical protein
MWLAGFGIAFWFPAGGCGQSVPLGAAQLFTRTCLPQFQLFDNPGPVRKRDN